MIRTTITLRVRYRDTDQMGIVYNGVYFEYFETGRTEMLRSLGMSYASIEQIGVLILVLEASARFHQPARYDDLLTVVTTLPAIPSATMKMEYRILRDDALLVTGHTLHAFATPETKRPVRPPRTFLDLLNSHWNEAVD